MAEKPKENKEMIPVYLLNKKDYLDVLLTIEEDLSSIGQSQLKLKARSAIKCILHDIMETS